MNPTPDPRNLAISVIIPVYNGEKTVRTTIECLLRQSLRPKEIIIVDDGSTDGTAEVIAKLQAQVIFLRKENGGPASARNRGVEAATSELVAFTDSDCLPDCDWLLRLAEGFDDPRVGGIGGIVRSVDHESAMGQYVDEIRLLDPLPDESGEIPYLITANACFRRSAILEAGLFNERFRKPGGEEPELCLRIRKLGYRFRMADRAVVLHHHRQTAGSLLRTISNYGEGRYLAGQLWPDYRIQNPHGKFLRRLVALRGVIHRISVYQPRYGFAKAVYFSILDYLRQLALLSGYLRAERREA